jgi:hypothetical protein
MKKYYTVYKITNINTNKFYIGAHETANPEDGYMGSGVYIKRAQKKYGIKSFVKEILFVFDTAQEMYAKEAELVQIQEGSYNIMKGGHGGWSYAKSKITQDSHVKAKITKSTREYWEKTADQRKASGLRIAQLQKDPVVRQRQAKTLSRTMNSKEWQETVGKERAAKISTTLKLKAAKIITEERNKKVADAMRGRVCVTLHGQKKRVKKNDPILNHPDIQKGW